MNSILSDIAQHKAAIEMLLALDDYDVSEFAQSWQQYQSELETFCAQANESDRAFLEAELQWVHARQAQVAAERQRIGGFLISLNAGRKAIDNYNKS